MCRYTDTLIKVSVERLIFLFSASDFLLFCATHTTAVSMTTTAIAITYIIPKITEAKMYIKEENDDSLEDSNDDGVEVE